MSQRCVWLLVLGVLAGSALAREPYESSYVPRPADDLVIRGAMVLTGTGVAAERMDVLVRAGRVAAVGADLEAPDALSVDGSGKWLTPGIIDVHSHLGAYPSPAVSSTRDGNESTTPNTALAGCNPSARGASAARRRQPMLRFISSAMI